MALPPEFVLSLRAMKPLEIMETFQTRPWKAQSILEIVNEVRPADLFCYLGARFGPPNGIQNFLRTDDSDNAIHWDWTLSHEHGVVAFFGMNFRTEVLLTGYRPHEAHRAELVSQLKADFGRQGPGMTAVRQHLELWTEFVNPYQRLRRSVERLLLSLDGLNLRPEEDRCDPIAADAGQSDAPTRWNELASRYSQGFGLCFGIRSMLPVMAEAFVNLLLYVLMRPEIRTDERLRENAFRQPIDVRVKSLSLNCIGFTQMPDYASEPCRAYQTLVNDRNDLLHGNVVIDKLKFNEVYFFGKVPVFKEYRTIWERSLQVEADSVGLTAVRSELSIVDRLVEYLLSCLDPKIRPEIEFMIHRHELGFEHSKHKTGVLFPEWLVDMRSGPVDPDEA